VAGFSFYDDSDKDLKDLQTHMPVDKKKIEMMVFEIEFL